MKLMYYYFTFVGASLPTDGSHERRGVTSSKPLTTMAPTSVVATESVSRSGGWPFVVVPGLNVTGLSSRGRMIESYDLEHVGRTYGDHAADLVQNQIRLDEYYDRYTPWTKQYGKIQNTPHGELVIGERIAQSKESTIYTLVNYPEFLIKYQANCYDIWGRPDRNDTVVHPLILDFWYGKDAAIKHVSMEPIFLSPPARPCPSMTGICRFDGQMSLEDFQHCRDYGGSIRYMIIRKSRGVSLATLRFRNGKGKLPFKLVMDIGAVMMDRLRDLHTEALVVHGDTVSYTHLTLPTILRV